MKVLAFGVELVEIFANFHLCDDVGKVAIFLEKVRMRLGGL